MDIREVDAEQFRSNIEKQGTHDIWVGPTTSGGYPVFKDWMASHIALALAGAGVPANHRVRYLCSDKRCVKPQHLGIYKPSDGPRFARTPRFKSVVDR